LICVDAATESNVPGTEGSYLKFSAANTEAVVAVNLADPPFLLEFAVLILAEGVDPPIFSVVKVDICVLVGAVDFVGWFAALSRRPFSFC
jgi:hypothetical protein